jgi:PAS domain S-box-containing protein
VNKTYCDAIGIPECDFLAVDHYSVLYDNDTSQRCIDSDKAALESSIPHTSHETVMFTDGQFHDLEIVKNRITDVHGNTLGLIGISLDITEQKRAKEELEEKKEKYRGLSEASFDAIFISEKGFCTEQNQTAEKMFGYSSSEAIGRYGTDWIVPEDRDQVMQNMLKGTEEPYEAIALKKDGTTFPCMIRGKMMFYKGKNMRVTSLSDITEFKRAQNALRDSDLRYRSLFQNTPSGIMLIDEYGIILEANEAIAKTTGYAYNELVGSDVRMLTAIENTYLVAENIQRIISGERTEQEVMSKRKDGTFCTLLLREVAILLPNGRPGVLSVSNDISDRKKVEAANKELESFSYSVSHDLKAPLRHISGFIHLLLENKSTEFSETDLGYINFISNSANEMGCLIDAILSFSRLNSSTLQFSTIHSSSLVNEVINFFKPEIQNRTIEFILESLPDIKGDIALIRQVWTNLISNAIKYTGKKSEALIVIGSFPEEKMITFFIRDNGAGFKMAKSGKLFGVFQRLHKANDFEGIGIGLANVNRIVMRHGGNCRAEGDPGNGATFYFSLPNGSV